MAAKITHLKPRHLLRQGGIVVHERLTEATFSDALAAIRRDLLGDLNYGMSSSDDDMLLISRQTVLTLLNRACYST